MNATTSAGAAMAASGNGSLRPAHGRGSLAAQQRRKGELLRQHLAHGGTVNGFARTHRITAKEVVALRDALPPTPAPTRALIPAPIAALAVSASGRPRAHSTRLCMDALADVVADGDGSIRGAAQALGFSRGNARYYWDQICADLGSRARPGGGRMMAAQASTSGKSEVRGYPVSVARMTAVESACEIFSKATVADALGITVRGLYDKREGRTGISDAEVRILLRDFTAMAARCERIAGNLVTELGAHAAPAPTLTDGATA